MKEKNDENTKILIMKKTTILKKWQNKRRETWKTEKQKVVELLLKRLIVDFNIILTITKVSLDGLTNECEKKIKQYPILIR